MPWTVINTTFWCCFGSTVNYIKSFGINLFASWHIHASSVGFMVKKCKVQSHNTPSIIPKIWYFWAMNNNMKSCIAFIPGLPVGLASTLICLASVCRSSLDVRWEWSARLRWCSSLLSEKAYSWSWWTVIDGSSFGKAEKWELCSWPMLRWAGTWGWWREVQIQGGQFQSLDTCHECQVTRRWHSRRLEWQQWLKD